jgi:uncharacterized glyoxalase superfamily protein PhnB
MDQVSSTTGAGPAHSQLTRTAHKIIPHLLCRDVAKTAAFYTDALHFDLGGLHLDVPMVSVFMGAKAEANIYIFGRAEEQDVTVGTVMVGLRKPALEQFYRVLVEEGRVEIVDPIGDRPWAFRQFDVKDLDGNVLQFWTFMDEES